MTSIYEDPGLYERQSIPKEPWTDTLDAIIEKYDVTDALDFGCGLGVDVNLMLKQGLDVYGLDGSETLRPYVLFNADRYRVFDLTEPINLGSDLVWCREVAEHIPAEDAEQLIDNIVTNARRVIYFTAASPGQIGHRHVNLQPIAYWIGLFHARGVGVDWGLTAINKRNPNDDDRQNGVVLCQQ